MKTGFTGRGKLNGSGKKCQGMTLVVPQISENKAGLYRLLKKSHLKLLFVHRELV